MKVNLRNRPVFGLVIPDMVKGTWADIASGIRQTAQKDGHGVCVPLCWDDPAAVLRHPSAFARLCAEAGIDGIFLRAFPDRRDTRRVLSALCREKIPARLRFSASTTRARLAARGSMSSRSAAKDASCLASPSGLAASPVTRSCSASPSRAIRPQTLFSSSAPVPLRRNADGPRVKTEKEQI